MQEALSGSSVPLKSQDTPVPSRAADWMFLQPDVLDESHDAVIATDLNGIITACNRAARSIYGYTPEELIGQSVEILYAHEDQASQDAVLSTVKETGNFRGEVRNRTRSGDYIFIHLCIALVKNGEGEPSGTIGFSVDVTGQKLSQLALQRSDAMELQNHAILASSARLRQTDLELRLANRRMENVLSRMTEGLSILDKDWTITYVNEQAVRIVGIRADDLLGRCVWDVFPAAKASKFYEGAHRSVLSGEPLQFDEFYPEPLNKWLECHCYPSDEGLSVYFRDITEQRHSLDAVQESNKRARLGMQVATLALAEVDYQSGMNHLSAEAAEMFGIGKEPVVVPRSAVHDTFHPEDRHDLELKIAQCLDPKGTGWFSMDHRVVWPNGQVHWLRVRKQVYFDGEGEARKPRRAMLAAFDVTTEKDAQESIVESEQRFRTLAESIPQLVWAANADGIKIYCNHKYLTYSGVDSLETLNRRWYEFLHPDDLQPTLARWRHSLETGEPYLAEYRLRRSDGIFRHFLARATPVLNGQGRIERWLGSSTDVHDQKMAEEALRRSEMLAAAGRLAASVAHEINNPLSSVINLMYLLSSEESLSERGREFVKTAQQELTRVSEITTLSLRFHKQSTAAVATRLNDLIDSAVALYTRRANALRIEITREFRLTEPLTCLASDLRQVLSNLISNGLDSMDGASGASLSTQRSKRLRLRLRQTGQRNDPTQQQIRITIADTGHGISKENLPRIFDAFFSTKSGTGTGLGLWICKDLVAKCGGTIRLKSSTKPESSGTVFVISLPL